MDTRDAGEAGYTGDARDADNAGETEDAGVKGSTLKPIPKALTVALGRCST